MITLEAVIFWFLAYTAVAIVLKKGNLVPSYLSISGPILLIHSEKGINTIHAIADKFENFWDYWGTTGLALSLIGMVGGFLFFVNSSIQAVQSERKAAIPAPKNFLVIPGVNDFLPLSAAPEIILALLIGMVIHEGGHAIMCRVGNIDISSTGLALFGLIPAGAFVEPDIESQEKASRESRLKMFSAGIMNNLAISVITFILFSWVFLAVIVPAGGAAVHSTIPGSPAEEIGLGGGDLITHVDGDHVKTSSELSEKLSNTPDKQVSITLASGATKQVQRSPIVTQAPTDLIEPGKEIESINGQKVSTIVEIKELATDSEEMTITLTDGEEVVVPTGALVVPRSDTPASGSGMPLEPIYITSVNGKNIASGSQLIQTINTYSAGETLTITTYSSGETSSHTLTLDQNGKMGVVVSKGYSGMQFNDFGVQYYPKEQVLQQMKSGALSDRVLSTLLLPFASLHPQLDYNFPGFTPDIENYYTTQGIPAPLEPLWFFLASLMFWTAWLNINLAIFNVLPTPPLDGGHIMKDVSGYLEDRYEWQDNVSTIIVYSVGAVTVLSFLLIMVSPML